MILKCASGMQCLRVGYPVQDDGILTLAKILCVRRKQCAYDGSHIGPFVAQGDASFREKLVLFLWKLATLGLERLNTINGTIAEEDLNHSLVNASHRTAFNCVERIEV